MISKMIDAFVEVLHGQLAMVLGADALSSLRQKAWDRGISMGLPNRKSDAFRYVPLRDFYFEMSQDAPFSSKEKDVDMEEVIKAVLPECQRSYIVFVDGALRLDLSDISGLNSEIVLLPLAQAMRSHGHFLQSHLLKVIKEEMDPFALLNLALHPAGIFLYIPPGLTLSAPVQCLHAATKINTRFTAARIHLVQGAHSTVKWVNTHIGGRAVFSRCATSAMDIFLEQGAHFEGISRLSVFPAHWCFDHVRAYLKRDAIMKTLNLLSGSKTTRHAAYVQCDGENCEADLKGLWMLRKSLHAHVYVTVDHNVPHTRSMQLFKGILFDAGQSSFEGKIRVSQAAQKTEAYQLNKHLLLGKAALAHSRPNLEIHADDVKASHGATVTRPDAAQLFYLKSRGIEEELAQQLLIQGFYKEILDLVPYPYLKEAVCDE